MLTSLIADCMKFQDSTTKQLFSVQPHDNNYEIWGNEFNRYFIDERLVFEKPVGYLNCYQLFYLQEVND